MTQSITLHRKTQRINAPTLSRVPAPPLISVMRFILKVRILAHILDQHGALPATLVKGNYKSPSFLHGTDSEPCCHELAYSRTLSEVHLNTESKRFEMNVTKDDHSLQVIKPQNPYNGNKREKQENIQDVLRDWKGKSVWQMCYCEATV